VIGSRPVPRIANQSNIPLQVLALLLSIFLWGFVRFTQTPFATTISQAEVQVPLDVTTDPEMAALEAPSSVSITVRGSEEAVRNLKANAISATVDLHGSAEGLLFPKVTVTPPPELTVISVQPERLSIRLVPIVTENLPVEARTSGHVAQGYIASAPILRTATVNVKGPRNYVQQVKSVMAVVTLNNTETGIMQRVLLEPRDEDGALVPDVTVSPSSEIATVNVTPAVVPRMLPVFPMFTGALPRDFTVETSWSPRIIPLVFPQGNGPTPSSLFTEPIDVSQLGVGEHRLTVDVPPPPGATLVKDKQVVVTIKVRQAKKAAAKGAEKKPHRTP
jgi:YbbR domain-containing protein